MIRVLYVDDEPLLLDICREFVELPGQIAMDTALSVSEAEAAMSRKDYDVIVSDYQMPEKDGIEFLKDIRQNLGHVPFILFTGRGREEVAIQALNIGADFYLQKGGSPSVQYGQLQKAIFQLAESRLTERSLAVSQRKYYDLVDGAKAIAVRLDPEMVITYVNPYGLKHLGWGDELIGTSFLDWLDRAKVGPDDHPRHIFMEMFALREKDETFTHSFRSKEGEIRWVVWTCRFIRNERGVISEVLLLGTDITQSKRNESELQRSLSLIKAAFDSSEEGLLVTGLDRNPTEFNPRFLEMWRVPESAVVPGNGNGLRELLKIQLENPEQFMSFLDDVYKHKLDEQHRTLEFTDGRKFEAFTRPVMIGPEVAGRFWSFKDVTQQYERERKAMIQAENLYGLLENNKAAMMLIDPVTADIAYANKAAVDFYGYGIDRLLAMKITDINTDNPDDVVREMGSARTEKKQYFTFRHRLAGGEVRDVEVFSGPVDFNGRQLLFSIVHDISEMKRTKRLVEESELRHNRILDSLAVGILVSDGSGKMVYANRTVQDMLQKRSDEIIGRSPVDMVADDLKEFARKNLAMRSRGESGKTDYRFTKGDGSELWVQVTAVPLFDNGVYGGTIASVVDISDQIRDAERIRDSESRFRDIFNNMRDAVMMHEPGGTFFEVNDLACERLGYSREELLKMRPENLDSPETVQAVPEKTKMIEEKGSAIFESVHVTKDGRRIPAEINAILIDYNGRPTILVVCRDITDRKVADERLARANEKLKILNSITRHDIMNQLMVLKGNLELAKPVGNDQALSARLEKIRRSADIIDSQLRFAKDYQEMGTALPQWQNVGRLISEQPDVKELKSLDVDRKLEQLEVYADPMLGKVFHNLLEDTIKYAEKPPRVKIGWSMRKTSLVLLYEDVGAGIPFDEKDRIFEMGYGKGTGLGLHLSREILSLTDIKIGETGEPGKGVRFEIEIPGDRFCFE